MIEHIQASQAQTTNVNYQPNPDYVEHLVRSFKTRSDVPLEYSHPVTSSVNTNVLRFQVIDEGVEARIFADSGELIKTIPPKDLLELTKENFIPSLGNLIDIRA